MAKKNPTKQKAKSKEGLKDLAEQMRNQNNALRKLLIELERNNKSFKRTESENHKKQN